MEGQVIETSPAGAPAPDVDRHLPLRSALSSLAGQYIMAITGLVLILFVFAHMAGNLLIFGGQDALNSYAHSLEEHAGLLWLARLVLLVVFIGHIAVGTLLTVQSRAARPIRYVCWKPLQSSWAARHMLLTGLLVLAFVVYHLLHFTFGVTDPGNFKYAIPTDPRGQPDVAGMVVGGFSQTPVAVGYVVAQIVLGLHLAHGAWSWFQHLGLNRENSLKSWSWLRLQGSGRRGYARLVHGFGVAVTVLVVLGNCSIPLAIQLGWRPTGLAGQLPASHPPRGPVSFNAKEGTMMPFALHPILAASAYEALHQFVSAYKVHPILVNFTAALLPVSVASDILGRVLARQTLRDTGWWTLCFAAVITPFTAIAGWLWWMEDDNGVTGMLVHRWLGTSLAVLLLGLVAWRWWFFKSNRWPNVFYLLVALTVVGALIYQGHLGGQQSFSM